MKSEELLQLHILICFFCRPLPRKTRSFNVTLIYQNANIIFLLDNDQELIQLDLTSRPQNQNGNTCKYKNTLATVKKMHAYKSGAMKKTGPIPRFEIIGRFKLTNVPHAISSTSGW